MRNVRKKLFLTLVLLIATPVLMEVAVRISGYAQHDLCDPIYMPFNASPDIPYVHKPNLVNAHARGGAIVNTDELGLRTKLAAGVSENSGLKEFRIAVVGDSVTFGEGVENNSDVYCQVLEDALNQKQSAVRVKVFNFAASAYSVKVMAATLEHRMLALKPDLVLMAIIPNDFNLSRTPTVDAYGNLSANTLSRFLSRDSRLRVPLRKIHLLYLIRDVTYRYFYKNERAEDALSAGGLPDSYSYIQEFKSVADENQLAYRIVLLPSGSPLGKL